MLFSLVVSITLDLITNIPQNFMLGRRNSAGEMMHSMENLLCNHRDPNLDTQHLCKIQMKQYSPITMVLGRRGQIWRSMELAGQSV